jgi:hypothetical protein
MWVVQPGDGSPDDGVPGDGSPGDGSPDWDGADHDDATGALDGPGLLGSDGGEGFARFGAEYVEAALAASGRRLLVADPAEADDDLVGDVAEILTWLCARLYGRRAAPDRAARALAAMQAGDA